MKYFVYVFVVLSTFCSSVTVKAFASAEETLDNGVLSQVYFSGGVLHEDRGDFYAERANRKEAVREYEEAIKGYKEAAEYDTQSGFLHLAIAKAMQKKIELTPIRAGAKKYEEMKDELHKAVVLNPGLAEPYYLLGGIYSHEQNHDSYVESFEKYVELAEKNDRLGVAYITLGKIYGGSDRGRKEDTGKAIKYLTKAIEFESRYPELAGGLYYSLGQLYEKKGDVFKAIDTYKKAIKSGNADGNFYAKISYLHMKTAESKYDSGLYNEATENYLKAVEYDSKCLKAYFGLVNVYSRMDKIKETTQTLEKAVKIFPENPGLRFLLGRVYEIQDYAEAEPEFKKALELDTSFREGYVYLAKYYFAKKKFDMMLEVLEKGGDVFPGDTFFPYMTGLGRKEKGELAGAVRSFRKVLEIDTGCVQASGHLTVLYEQLGDTENMADVLQAIVDNDVRNVHQRLFLAYLYSNMKKYDKAADLYKWILEKYPEDTYTRYNLAVLYDKSDNQDSAVKEFIKIIEIDPENADALNYVGYLYAERGVNLDESIELIKRAIKIKPNDGYFMDSLAWAYFRKGMLKESMSEIERAVSVANDDPVIYEHYGEILYNNGRIKDALDAYRKAVELDSSNDKLREKFNRIRKELE